MATKESNNKGKEREPLPGFFDDRSDSYKNIKVISRPENATKKPGRKNGTKKSGK